MDSQDISAELHARCVRMLEQAGHTGCAWSRTARYDGPSGQVVCGCGEFTAWQEADPDAVGIVAVGGTTPRQAADPIDSTLALIDPDEQYGPVDVERHILDVLARLETGALFERETVRNHFAAKQAFDMKYNVALLDSVQSSADRRKADAMVKCEAEARALAEAEMLLAAVKATMHNLRAVLSGYQSTARSVGAAYVGGGAQQAHTR